MGKRGPKSKINIDCTWSPDFAYAIGLIATDGNLSRDGRHISFVSKDKEQILNFLKGLKVKIYIGKSYSGYSGNSAFRVQFSNISFYQFLLSIGLTPAKSKTIGALKIPDKYFFDFLRGCFDGDGTIYSYWDKRWKSSFMFYISFATASFDFMTWLRNSISKDLGISGHVKKDGKGSTYQLTYAKKDSLKILKAMFKEKNAISLTRKRLKIKKILSIVGKDLYRS